jgi:hypothetical protein
MLQRKAHSLEDQTMRSPNRRLLFQAGAAAWALLLAGCASDTNFGRVSLAPDTAAFTAVQGAAATPAGVTVAVTNAGTGVLFRLESEVLYTAGQPNGWLSAELAVTTAPTTLALSAQPGTLPPGTYQARAWVRERDARSTPSYVSVTLTVTAE